MRRSPLFHCLLAALFLTPTLGGAQSQQSPPDFPDAAEAALAKAPAGPRGKAAPHKITAMPAAKIEAIFGKTLELNGDEGALVVDRRDGELTVDKLVLKGESTGSSGQPCTIEVRGDAPMTVKPKG